jgi:hypothetical protein
VSRCCTLGAVPSISPRALSEVPPEEFVEHRTRLVCVAQWAGAPTRLAELGDPDADDRA